MWALPDLDAINEQALTTPEQRRLALAAEHECDYCEKPATKVELYYHLFCDDPVGTICTCDEHEDWASEHHFYCCRCDRMHVRNYTWENYVHTTDEGEELCLNCYREVYLDYENHWLDVGEAIALPPDELYERVKAAPHLFAVGQEPQQHGLAKVADVTLDSMSGTEVLGFSSSADSPSSAILAFRQAVTEAHEKGASRFVFILDGAYQFCVSIGVYIEAKEGAEPCAA